MFHLLTGLFCSRLQERPKLQFLWVQTNRSWKLKQSYLLSDWLVVVPVLDGEEAKEKLVKDKVHLGISSLSAESRLQCSVPGERLVSEGESPAQEEPDHLPQVLAMRQTSSQWVYAHLSSTAEGHTYGCAYKADRDAFWLTIWIKKLDFVEHRPHVFCSDKPQVDMINYTCSFFALPFGSEDEVNWDSFPFIVGNFNGINFKVFNRHWNLHFLFVKGELWSNYSLSVLGACSNPARFSDYCGIWAEIQPCGLSYAEPERVASIISPSNVCHWRPF